MHQHQFQQYFGGYKMAHKPSKSKFGPTYKKKVAIDYPKPWYVWVSYCV